MELSSRVAKTGVPLAAGGWGNPDLGRPQRAHKGVALVEYAGQTVRKSGSARFFAPGRT